MQDVLKSLLGGETLAEAEAEAVFERILTGGADEAQIGALLALMRQRGATTDELVGGARAMRRHVTRVPTEGLEALGALIDTCGTGGAPKTFNVSTAVAIVTAAARGDRRALVAKHGSRSRSGRGSAETLERLGVNVAAPVETQRRCLEEIGVCFCFAIHHHPAMRFAAGPRKSLGFQTIFNLLGPLTNPAMAPRQFMGVYDRGLVEQMGEALRRLGAERAMVVHGLDGLDELTTTSPSMMAEVSPSGVTLREVDASDLGLERATMSDLQQVSDLDEAAALLRRVISGQTGPSFDMVCLNAGGALVVAGAASDLTSGVAVAREAIESGRAREALERLVELTNASQ